MKDPHYGVFGASILPPKLGAWYVVELLGRAQSYAVGRFPVASEIIWLLHESQVEIIGWWPAPKRDIGFLTPLLRWYRLNTLRRDHSRGAKRRLTTRHRVCR